MIINNYTRTILCKCNTVNSKMVKCFHFIYTATNAAKGFNSSTYV